MLKEKKQKGGVFEVFWRIFLPCVRGKCKQQNKTGILRLEIERHDHGINL